MHAECAGQNQSPINIQYTETQFDDTLPDFDVVATIGNSQGTMASNNGHTRKCSQLSFREHRNYQY